MPNLFDRELMDQSTSQVISESKSVRRRLVLWFVATMLIILGGFYSLFTHDKQANSVGDTLNLITSQRYRTASIARDLLLYHTPGANKVLLSGEINRQVKSLQLLGPILDTAPSPIIQDTLAESTVQSVEQRVLRRIDAFAKLKERVLGQQAISIQDAMQIRNDSAEIIGDITILIERIVDPLDQSAERHLWFEVALVVVIVGVVGFQVFRIQFPAAGRLDRLSSENENISVQYAGLETVLCAYRDAIDQGSLVSICDADGRVTYVNEPFEATYGYPAHEIVGHKLAVLNSNEHDDQIWRDIINTVRGGNLWTGEICNRAKDGRLVWQNSTVSPVKSSDGRVVSYISISVDITELKEARKAEMAAQERFAKITRNVPGMLYQFIRYPDGTYTLPYASDAVKQIYGIDPAETEDMVAAIFSAIHPDDFGMIVSSVEDSARHLTPWTAEYRSVFPDKSMKWVFGSSSPELLEDGTICWYGFISDITAQKTDAVRIAAGQERLELIQSAVPIGIWDWNVQTDELVADNSMISLYGLDPETTPVTREQFSTMALAEDREVVSAAVRQAIESQSEFDVRFRIRRADGELRWMHTRARVLSNEQGETTRLVGVTEDITERTLAELALIESEERYALAAKGANDGLWDWNLRTGSVFYSERWQDIVGLYGLEPDGSEGEWLDRVHPDDKPELLRKLDLCKSGETGSLECEHRILRSSGEWHWMHVKAAVSHDAEGKAIRIVGSITDVQGQKSAENKLVSAAKTDKLTGLWNRSALMERLGILVDQSRQTSSHRFALMFLDFDRFKIINDSLGHGVGDELLQVISARLCHAVRTGKGMEATRKGNMVARMGGDEFVVLLDDIRSPEEARAIANRLLAKLSEPYRLGEQMVHTSASIGLFMNEMFVDSADQILRDADAAMYEAKRGGKNRYVEFDSQMRERIQLRIQIENDLRTAVDDGQFYLHFQPILNLVENKVESFECLLRWNHPERGLVSPADFIPIAEENGQIISIGEWVMREACRSLKIWAETSPQTLPESLSVNVSRYQIQLPGFAERILEIVKHEGIEPNRIHLEVTESAIMVNSQVACNALRTLREMGFRIDLDDFGTGYTSLADLDQFPLDVVKIDRSFIADLDQGGTHIDMIRAICTLSGSIGSQVVAEGVETEEQLQMLYYLGVDMVQGYLLGRPTDLNRAMAFQCDLGRFIRSAA